MRDLCRNMTDARGWVESRARRLSSGAVSNRAACRDIAGHAADGKARLIAQALGELHEAVRVGEVADDSERHPHRPRALATAAGDQVEKTPKVHVRIEFKRGTHIRFGDPFGCFSRAWVAEAAGSKRDVSAPRDLLDTAVVDQVAFRIVEVHRDRAATRVGCGGSVNPDHVVTVTVLQPYQTLQQPRCQTTDTSVDR